MKHSELQKPAHLNMPYPSNPNPNKTEITLYTRRNLITIENSASYINLEGLTLRCGAQAISFGAGANHINIRNSDIKGGRTTFMLNDTAHHIVFDGITMNGYMPPWVSFTDVKLETQPENDAATTPAYFLKLGIFNMRDNVNNIEIKNSSFRNTFDGIVGHVIHDIHIHDNLFYGVRDDIWQVNTGSYAWEIDHNKFIYAKGISRQEQGVNPPEPGTKYIHHNIFDLTRQQLHGRPGTEIFEATGDGMTYGPAFARHGNDGVGLGDPWKIYNNTFIIANAVNGNNFKQSVGHEYDYAAFIPGNPQEVYNNIFIQTAEQRLSDHGHNADVSNGSQIYDGNLYYRPSPAPLEALFVNYRNGATESNFSSLAAFKSSVFFNDSKGKYPPGIENSAVEADPMLDSDHYPAASGPAATGAINLSAKGWPGTDGAVYRGALAPLSGSSPVITSVLNSTGTIGTAFSYQIAATNSPTSFNATGLPAGLSVSTVTGLISGTPTTSGTSSVSISAANASGTGSASLALRVYSACDLNCDWSPNVVDVQLQVNQALGVAACTSDLNRDGSCNVIDVQRDVNAALGGPCVLGP